MFIVGETVTFKIGRHVNTGVVAMSDHARLRLFVEVSKDVYELVYEDEVVTGFPTPDELAAYLK